MSQMEQSRERKESRNEQVYCVPSGREMAVDAMDAAKSQPETACWEAGLTVESCSEPAATRERTRKETGRNPAGTRQERGIIDVC